MTRHPKIFLAIALTFAALGATAIAIRMAKMIEPPPPPPLTLIGAVLSQNSDSRKQIPLSAVEVTATGGSTTVTTESDPAGFFSLTLKPGPEKSQAVVLTFAHADYEPLEITATKPGDQLYIARMQRLEPEVEVKARQAEAPAKIVEIKNLRVRYAFKSQSTIGAGSLAKQFTALNKGNIPCRGQKPCSPDGRWKATITTLPLDAEDRNEFRNVRVSCIAGPCAFTKIEPDTFAPSRKIAVSILNWSDPADFLVEADVMRTMVTDQIRHSYPFVLGQTMNFALPPGSEGPSVEADLDGQHIVFPLGPAVILSWATCRVEIPPDGNKLYRCQLKPGYRFQQ